MERGGGGGGGGEAIHTERHTVRQYLSTCISSRDKTNQVRGQGSASHAWYSDGLPLETW